jgi:enoyl-CoA hydratase
LSVKVTMRALARHGRPDVSLKRALAEEYRMSQRFMTMEADFVEGVRAVLVDKDQKPKWRHAGLEAVSDADVDRFFLPLDKAHPRGELWG